VARRQGVALGQRLGGYRPPPTVERDVDNGSDSQETLLGEQRHTGTGVYIMGYNARILRTMLPLVVNRSLARRAKSLFPTLCAAQPALFDEFCTFNRRDHQLGNPQAAGDLE
jgi:hypothetical protein